MHHEAQYDVTPEVQRLAAKQMFIAVYLKKKWIGIAFFAIISIFTIIYSHEFGWIPFAVFGSITFILTSMWIKSYFALQENAQSYLRTIGEPKNVLTITDDEMVISNSNGMKRIVWDTIDRFVITQDFVIPIVGKVPIICLPKSELSSEVIAWFRSRQK